MTTSVRLTPQVEQSLTEYCKRKGVTKTEVMIKAIVDYIAKDIAPASRAANQYRVEEASAIYLAFERSGFVGAVSLQASSSNRGATKEQVRSVIAKRLKRASKET